MSKPERRDPEKEAFWRGKIQSYRQSGLGQAQFCREQGLNVNSLNAWVRIIKGRDEENRVAARRAGSKGDEPYWSFVLEDWRQSGLSLSEFARGRRLKYQSLCYWKARICPDVPDVDAASKRDREAACDPFVPVHVVDSIAGQADNLDPSEIQETAVLEIALRGGRLIRVSPNFDAKFLTAVIMAVESC